MKIFYMTEPSKNGSSNPPGQKLPRRLTAKELADLPPDGWENAKVDVRRYYVAFSEAFEVGEEAYNTAREGGVVCQVVNGRYIITNG